MSNGFALGFGFMPGIDSYNKGYTEQEVRSYIYRKLEDTPAVDKGVKHTVKKGENLWSIAEKYLKKEKPKNSEIQDFMYKIAKLNGKQTLEDLNTLDVNDTLYIPSDVLKAENTATTVNGVKEPDISNYEKVMNAAKRLQELTAPKPTDNSYSQKTITKYEKIEKLPNEVFEAHGHAGFNNWTDELKNNNDLILEKSYSVSPTKPFAVVFTKKVKNSLQTEAMFFAEINSDGTLKKVAFSAPGFDVKAGVFDYEVDENGNLSVAQPSFIGKKNIGKISKEEYEALKAAVEPRIKEYLKIGSY